MTAISLFRRRRAIRFAAFGAYIGATLMITTYVVVIGLGWLANVHPGYELEHLPSLALNAAISAAIFAVIAGTIGAATARVSARMWAWRVLGALVSLASVAMFVWTFVSFQPTLTGWVIVTFVTGAGIATGVLVWLNARDKSVDALLR